MAKAKAKGKGKGDKCWCEGLPPLVVTSKVKAYVKSKKMMTASDSIAAINCKIYCKLAKAIERAQANRRSTVKPQDL
jgi:hypothetical protein